MMNLVMFGYFVSTQYFADMTDIDMKKMLFEQRMREIEEDIVPFGYIQDNSDQIDVYEQDEDRYKWQVEYDPNL